MHITVSSNRVQCGYNAVNFLQNSDETHNIARPLGRVIVRLLDSISDLLFCIRDCRDVCQIVLYWTALKRPMMTQCTGPYMRLKAGMSYYALVYYIVY